MDAWTILLSASAAAALGLLAWRMARRRPPRAVRSGPADGKMSAALAAEWRRARRLNVPDAATQRFIVTYRRRGLSELQALQKMTNDLERDRACWQG